MSWCHSSLQYYFMNCILVTKHCDLLEDPEGSLVAWIRVAQATATKINCEFMKQCKNNVEEPRRLLNNVLLATSRLLFYEANTFASGRIKFRRGSSVGEAEHLRNPWWIILYCLQAGPGIRDPNTQQSHTGQTLVLKLIPCLWSNIHASTQSTTYNCLFPWDLEPLSWTCTRRSCPPPWNTVGIGLNLPWKSMSLEAFLGFCLKYI